MIDIKTKKAILRKLASDGRDPVQNSLKKEAKKIEAVLNEASDFRTLRENIDLLDAFAYRVPEQTLSILDLLLKRLETIEISYELSSIISEEAAARFYSKNRLINTCLNIYQQIRYFDVEKILKTFLKYSTNKDRSIQKQAIDGISDVAQYNFEVYQKQGLYTQQKVVHVIESLSTEERTNYFQGLVIICKDLLLPELRYVFFNASSITLNSANHPGDEDLQDIRKRTIVFLESLYQLATDIEDNKKVLNTLQDACRLPQRLTNDEKIYQIILKDAQDVNEVLEKIVCTEENLQLIQEMEHNTYWVHYHHTDSTIRESTCRIKRIIDSKEEYQIFKVLIGVRGIFYSWCDEVDQSRIGNELRHINDRYQRSEQFREQRFQELVTDVVPENYAQWEKRIITWSGIKSNDGATFVYFVKFLESLGKSKPNFALKLINEHDENVGRFMVPLMTGIFQSNQKNKLQSITQSWLSKEKHLRIMAKFCKHVEDFNLELLEEIAQISMKQKDQATLYECLSSLFLQFSKGGNALVNTLFPEILEVLTEHQDSLWIQHIWYQKNLQAVVQAMEEETIDAVLNNLVFLERVDYEAEHILSVISESNPEKVLDFFGRRIRLEKEDPYRNHEAIPSSFDELRNPLAKKPKQVVEASKRLYDDQSSRFFRYSGGRLVSNTFPEFEKPLEKEMLELLKKGNKKDREFILAILNGYRDNPNTYTVIIEFVKRLPKDSNKLNDIMMVLLGTGVVTGEYGFVEAYKRKKEIAIESWLQDDDPKIRAFAESYIEMLDRIIEGEEQRAKENITLMKHRFQGD